MPLFHYTIPENVWLGHHTSSHNPRNRYFTIAAEDPKDATEFFHQMIAPFIAVDQWESRSLFGKLVDVEVKDSEEANPLLQQGMLTAENYLGSISPGRWIFETTDRLYRGSPAVIKVWVEVEEANKRRIVVLERKDDKEVSWPDFLAAVEAKF